MNTEHTAIQRIVTDFVPVGYWLVTFNLLWEHPHNFFGHDYDTEKSCDCSSNTDDINTHVGFNIVQVTRDNYMNLDVNVRNITTEDNKNDLGWDLPDTRYRLFKTKQEAQQHADCVVMEYSVIPYEQRSVAIGRDVGRFSGKSKNE